MVCVGEMEEAEEEEGWKEEKEGDSAYSAQSDVGKKWHGVTIVGENLFLIRLVFLSEEGPRPVNQGARRPRNRKIQQI